MRRNNTKMAAWGLLASLALVLSWSWVPTLAGEADSNLEWQLPRTKEMQPFAKQQPIVFVSSQNYAEWSQLKSYWNPTTESVPDPTTGAMVTRTIVKIKVPLGLNQGPKVPVENTLTVARWELGRDLYFDRILSSDSTVACASCHNPGQGFTDQLSTSVGIKKQKGGMNAPTVINSAFNVLQFWDGRASSLEDQAQGPVQNPVEMFDSQGHHWNRAVTRVRSKGDYTKRFLEAYGCEPTRDVIAKAIANYERTVLSGNSVHDRAELAMKVRVADDGGTDYTLQAKDYEGILKEVFAKNDVEALQGLDLDVKKDVNRVKNLAASIKLGRDLFFGKARCTLCHVGDNFTDNLFHNLGVGAKDGLMPMSSLGRYGAQQTGLKEPEMVGAFKTPGLRGLASTFPYMHDGSEVSLEKVIDLYDRGGNPNPTLDPKMRDLEAERAYVLSKQSGTPYKGPKVYLTGTDAKPIVPFALNLTPAEKSALVHFLRSLQGEIDAIVNEPIRKAMK